MFSCQLSKTTLGVLLHFVRVLCGYIYLINPKADHMCLTRCIPSIVKIFHPPCPYVCNSLSCDVYKDRWEIIKIGVAWVSAYKIVMMILFLLSRSVLQFKTCIVQGQKERRSMFYWLTVRRRLQSRRWEKINGKTCVARQAQGKG